MRLITKIRSSGQDFHLLNVSVLCHHLVTRNWYYPCPPFYGHKIGRSLTVRLVNKPKGKPKNFGFIHLPPPTVVSS